MKQFNKNTKHTKELLFIAAALPTAAMHKSENLEHIYSTGQKIVATDGHRLHIYTPTECPLEAGYYQVIKKTKTEIILNPVELDQEYPDFERITPDREGKKDFTLYQYDNGRTAAPNLESKYAEVIRALPSGTINIKYFQDACLNSMTSFKVTDGVSPVCLYGESLQAVVMPVMR